MPDLSDNVNWSEVDANNNQAPPNGWPEGMMPSSVNDAARADRGAMKRFWNKLNPVQTIMPSGNLWTFTTGNSAYPTSYVPGELYCFYPGTSSVGGDQFQVNALGFKPILKHETPGLGGWIPIIAFDIRVGHAAQLVYDPNLNAGTGAFALQNPVVPIQNDGTGTGVSISNLTLTSNLVVNRNSAPPPAESVPGIIAIAQLVGEDGVNQALLMDSFGAGNAGVTLRHANGTNAFPQHLNAGDLIGTYGFLGYGATAYATHGVARMQAIALDTFTDFAMGSQLQFLTTVSGTSNPPTLQVSMGPGLTVGAPTGPSGGLQIGDINAQRVFCQGQPVSVLASDGSANISGNATVSGTLGVTGTTTLGNASVGGALNVAGASTLTGNVTSPAQVQAENLRSVGDSYIGNNLYVSGGAGNITASGQVQGENLRSVGDSYIGNNLYVTGTINGSHFPFIFDTLTAQVESLTARVATLEATIADLQRQLP